MIALLEANGYDKVTSEIQAKRILLAWYKQTLEQSEILSNDEIPQHG